MPSLLAGVGQLPLVAKQRLRYCLLEGDSDQVHSKTSHKDWRQRRNKEQTSKYSHLCKEILYGSRTRI